MIYDIILIKIGVYMKKIFILCAALLVGLSCVEAKDYVKMQIKEMQKAQKYGTTQKVLQTQPQLNAVTNLPALKDPKIMKFGDYKKISKTDYDLKLKKDEAEYKKTQTAMLKKSSKAYKTQANPEDYYKIYRIAEKIIRANNLDYINWRIAIIKDTQEPNAYTANTNFIAITTAMFDTFNNNEDALAMVIGHEMGHALLGHQKRLDEIRVKLARLDRLRGAVSGVYTSRRAFDMAVSTNNYAKAGYAIQARRLLAESKKMEFAADVEGARLAAHAGYDLDKGINVLTYFNTFSVESDRHSSHPNAQKRIENFNQNRKYFPEEWKEIGEYNIYNSNVLPAQLSSDRKSMVISVPDTRLNPNKFYSPETMDELYARLGYMYYKNGEFAKSAEYFGELFKIDQTNAPAYLYASYVNEYLYKNTKNSKYLTLAKEYAKKAQSLDSGNKYIKEQVDNL